MPEGDRLVVHADPTKDFFITMLVKDIGLVPAIVDLVDNCVDGALRMRQDRDFDGLSVRIEFDHSHFRVADNCGGIAVEIARNYAFRFGRPPGMAPTRHSVGQFGVGMKRALFKIGSKFSVASTSPDSRFALQVDVDEWRREEKNWTFQFSEVEEDSTFGEEDQGTVIEVRSLHEGISEDFDLENFSGRLRNELQSTHQHNLNHGLAITVNGVPLQVESLQLLASSQLKPAFVKLAFPSTKHPKMRIGIYCGIADSDPESAGWYVFCNGRLILEADQTINTGWGEGHGRTIPKYHNQFARFRGFTFFEADNSSLLPWNTTKTGVDEGSKVFKAVRQKMIGLMRPVIDFLNNLDAEKDRGKRPLHQELEQRAKAVTLAKLKASPVFAQPKADLIIERACNISYKKPEDEVDRVKENLGATTLREVGEKTFEYFFEMECEE